MLPPKQWISSNTLQFFALVLVGGGTDAIIEFLRSGVIDVKSVLIMVIAVAGIALRLKTTQPLT